MGDSLFAQTILLKDCAGRPSAARVELGVLPVIDYNSMLVVHSSTNQIGSVPQQQVGYE